jgi:hypothetical protein
VDIWRRARKIFQQRAARVVKRETDELSASSKKKNFASAPARRSSNFDTPVALSHAAAHFPEKMPSHQRISYHRAPLGL